MANIHYERDNCTQFNNNLVLSSWSVVTLDEPQDIIQHLFMKRNLLNVLHKARISCGGNCGEAFKIHYICYLYFLFLYPIFMSLSCDLVLNDIFSTP